MIVDTIFWLLLIAIFSFSAESIAGAGIAMTADSGYLNDKKVYIKKKQESAGEFNFIKGVLTAVPYVITCYAIFLMSTLQ